MIDQLARSATYGFGASAGRDLYKNLKKGGLFLLAAMIGFAGLVLIALGFRNLYLGMGRSTAYKLFVTIIGSVLMIVLGSAIIVGLFLMFAAEDASLPVGVMAGTIGVAALYGNIRGWTLRKRIEVEAEKVAHNRAFLKEIGLRDSEFDSDMMEDTAGNCLKLAEQTDDKMVFTIAGKRGQRAAIKLSDGLMIEYTGVTKL